MPPAADPAQHLPAPPPPGLRARKKAAAMHHIQETAIALFEQHGYARVTIEQVAAASEVSASTVYRYFGTKEGLVLHDEFDDQVMLGLSHYLQQGLSPWTAAEAALGLVGEGHFVVQAASTRSRIRLWFANESIQAQALLAIDQMVDEVARVMAGTGRWTRSQSRVIAASIIWPFMAALKNWSEFGSEDDWHVFLDEAIAALKAAAPR